jgi:hypothetical protein
MADTTEDAPLSPDERAAKKAADDHQKEVAAALLTALLLLRGQVTTVTYWIPSTWADFREAAGSAIDPAFTAFDKAARAVWMGYDSLEAATLEDQRRMKERFVQEFGDSTRRAVEKAIAWGQANGITGADMDAILAHIVGVNGNQAGSILANWLMVQETGAEPHLLDKMLADAAKEALKDRVGVVAGDVLWDAVQAGRMAGGMQEQRATNAQIVKTWRTAADERVCPQCGPLHGVTVGIGSPFPGGVMAPRLHSHCRCWMVVGTAEEGAF